MLISIYGDSLSTFEGMNPPGHIVYYNIDNRMRHSLMEVSETWWGRVLNEFGWELLVNASYSGSRVSGSGFPSACSYERMGFLQNERTPDIILVYLGYNDFGFCVPLKSENSENDPMCFYDAYCLMLKRLKEKYPNSRVICGTVMQNYIFYRPDISERLEKNRDGTPLSAYNEAIKSACVTEKVECADLHGTGIRCDSLSDSHCTGRGHKEMAEAWIKELKRILL